MVYFIMGRNLRNHIQRPSVLTYIQVLLIPFHPFVNLDFPPFSRGYVKVPSCPEE